MPTSPEGTLLAHRVWKRFRADRNRAMLRDELARLAQRVRGNSPGGYRWALRDVSLKVEPGESVGLVGLNGSGKSTLLKILTRVMHPYAGKVELTGRVGALIEVVSGIHHELTGRENLYLYGSLMGLPRSTIARRFDELVAFAELEDAIDRQVKFYSLGMQMRLGFSVAAFLDSQILLVDEVLAVGDAAFQQKCLDRMRYLLTEGTTLVLVSHDLPSVEATCARGVWLRKGTLALDGPVREVLTSYRQSIEAAVETLPVRQGADVRLLKTEVRGFEGAGPQTHQPLEVALAIESTKERYVAIGVGISEGTATPIFVESTEPRLVIGENHVVCRFANVPIPRGRYYVWVCVSEPEGSDLVGWHPAAQFDVYGPALGPAPLAVVRLAPVHVNVSWEVESVGR